MSINIEMMVEEFVDKLEDMVVVLEDSVDDIDESENNVFIRESSDIILSILDRNQVQDEAAVQEFINLIKNDTEIMYYYKKYHVCIM
jgi:hypothetical protein